MIRRFAQGVEENPHSAYWHEPTGFIRDQWGDASPVPRVGPLHNRTRRHREGRG